MKRKLYTESVVVTMTKEDLEKLVELSTQMGLSKSGVIRSILRQTKAGTQATITLQEPDAE